MFICGFFFPNEFNILLSVSFKKFSINPLSFCLVIIIKVKIIYVFFIPFEKKFLYICTIDTYQSILLMSRRLTVAQKVPF